MQVQGLLVWALVCAQARARARTPPVPPAAGVCPAECRCSRARHFASCSSASLSALPRFEPGHRIAVLLLPGNRLGTLHAETFLARNLTEVALLDLSNNNITRVEPGAFAGLFDSLLSLYLRENPHIQLPEDGLHLEALIDLDLSFCGLKTIQPKFFTSTANIKFLRLNDNLLTSFDPVITHPGKGLQLAELDLSRNQLTKLDVMLVLDTKMALRMFGNPFHCDCAFLTSYSLLEQQDKPAAAGLTCRTPAHLQGVTGESLQRQDMRCPPHNGTELQPPPPAPAAAQAASPSLLWTRVALLAVLGVAGVAALLLLLGKGRWTRATPAPCRLSSLLGRSSPGTSTETLAT